MCVCVRKSLCVVLVCVCVCGVVCVWCCVCERERERERVCVCVCVRERERESVCVCVCVCGVCGVLTTMTFTRGIKHRIQYKHISILLNRVYFHIISWYFKDCSLYYYQMCESTQLLV